MVEQRFNGFIRIRLAYPTGRIRQRNGPPIQAVMQGGRAVISEQSQMPSNMISLAERMVFSDSFKPIYAEGMDMVEEAASYLDGEGREDARNLSRVAATLYAAESMRLTTRLMQVASWLLLQRAARNAGPNCLQHSWSWSNVPCAFRRVCAVWTAKFTVKWSRCRASHVAIRFPNRSYCSKLLLALHNDRSCAPFVAHVSLLFTFLLSSESV